MPNPADQQAVAVPALARWPTWKRWLALVVVSVLLIGALEAAHLSAALLLGSMAAAVSIGRQALRWQKNPNVSRKLDTALCARAGGLFNGSAGASIAT